MPALSSTKSAALVKRGKQQPRLEWIPRAHTRAAADECIALAGSAGLHLDPWQQHVIRGALGEKVDGTWQAFEVCLIVPRQNGKGAILEALELYWLFACDYRLILHSAHEFKTAREGFLRLRGLIEATPELAGQVRQFYASTGGECGIELHDGKRLRFVARSSGAGRGFSPDVLVLDEAYNLPDTAIDAQLPAVGAKANPQVWYTSSAGDFTVAPCDVLARLRRRGITGGDEALAYFEWSVPYDEHGRVEGDPADPRLWAAANPSLGFRKTAERVAKFHRSMSPAGFAREELGVGTWPAVADYSAAFGPGKWEACGVRAPEPPPIPAALGFAVSLDRAWASIGAASAPLEDGKPHLGAVTRERGTAWLEAELLRLQQQYGCPIAVDGKGPAASLIEPLTEAGVELTVASTGDYLNACAAIFDLVDAEAITHGNYTDLNNAVGDAEKRKVGDRWAWARRFGDVAMLEAVTLAAWAAGEVQDYDVLDSVY